MEKKRDETGREILQKNSNGTNGLSNRGGMGRGPCGEKKVCPTKRKKIKDL